MRCENERKSNTPINQVLILVLVEYALRVNPSIDPALDEPRLNPCFSGICAASKYPLKFWGRRAQVLILVLVEYALRGEKLTAIIEDLKRVLILVLVEYALRDLVRRRNMFGRRKSLNPCFSGICAARHTS